LISVVAGPRNHLDIGLERSPEALQSRGRETDLFGFAVETPAASAGIAPPASIPRTRLISNRFMASPPVELGDGRL
jgi:hypothetical protein